MSGVLTAHADVQTLLFVVGVWCCVCIVVAVITLFRAQRFSVRSLLRIKDENAKTGDPDCGITTKCGNTIKSMEKHDVFLSFRGEDTRRGFTSHLYEALDRIKIQTYIDYKLERGDEIAPSLLDAISESKISVVIFSKNYASSRWCLDELVHILKFRASQFLIPVFYDVDPSDVRKQSGSYAEAFVEHEKRFEDYKLKEWREALSRAGNISGFESDPKIISSEAELVKLVVNDVLAKLNRESQIQSLEGLVGIEKHIQNVELLLSLDSHHVIRTVGIWGMGGIGKTTIADVVFHRLSSQFKDCCFLQNVRERSETREGLYDLRNELLRTLLNDKDLHVATQSIGSTIMTRLRRTKALVVLDDVGDLAQVEFFTGVDGTLFARGSRIIVTARNKRVLGVDGALIYKVKKLDHDEALDLFHLRALGSLSPTTDYETLSRELVDYAGGNPLALTVLGLVFSHCRSREDWEGELEKLKKYPDKKIQNTLRLSYDALGENEKSIFLDIACFHKGKFIGTVERILKSCGFSANAGLRLLVDMSLISVDKYSRVQMHDLIQEMGRKIVSDECDKNPGKRSRLWHADEIGPVLKENKGTKAIECIVLKMDDLNRDLGINAASFEKMNNLRLLDIHSTGGVNKVRLLPDFKFLPDALKYLRWDFYPQPSLPPRFSAENLVELHMSHSRLERLWHKDMQVELGSLKKLDFSYSKNLTELPDLSESPNLENIKLEGCSSLVQLPSTLHHQAKLSHLLLPFCSSLKVLPEMPRNLEVLLLLNTKVEELHSSIWSLEKLRVFGIDSCTKLKNLPTSTCILNSLRSLSLEDCHSLDSLPVGLPAGLEDLHMRGCKSVRSLPDVLPSELKRLFLSDCNNLVSLPIELPTALRYLDLNNCTNLASLPVELPAGLEVLDLNHCETLVSLPVELPAGLRRLYLRGCKSLVSLPMLSWLLQRLDAQDCTSLKTVSSSMMFASLQGRYEYLNDYFEPETFDFSNCLKLDQTVRSNILADAQFRLFLFATTSPTSRLPSCWYPGRVVCPGNEIPKWIRYQNEGCSVSIRFPPHWFRQGFLGFALCIVFESNNVAPVHDLFYENRNSVNLVCQTCHKINNGEVVCSGTIPIHPTFKYQASPNSDHVLAWYFLPEYIEPETTISSEGSKDWVEASFSFRLELEKDGKRNPLEVSSTMKLKRCGVSLVYDQGVETCDEDAVIEAGDKATSLKFLIEFPVTPKTEKYFLNL